MNIHSALLQEHSKAQALAIADYIGNNQQRFTELLDLFFNGHYRTNQRAAWPMVIIAKRKPSLLQPHLERFIINLENNVHDAVRRNTLRFLQDIEIPKKLQGRAVDSCFKFLGSTEQPIAVKVFAMTVIYNICKEEPDLKNELKLMIEAQIEEGSAGFKSRGKKILRGLEKL